MLPWDGSHIGVISHHNIIARQTINNRVHMKLQIGLDIYIVRVVDKSISIPCIVDELKTIFNVKKNGTHRIKLGTKELAIIRQPTTPRDNLKYFYRVSEVHTDFIGDTLLNSIRRVLLFREIVGLTSTFESNLYIIGDSVYSMSENSLVEYTTPAMSETIKNSYFEESISLLIRRMVGLTRDIDVTETIFNLRCKIESVVRRIDRDRIDIVDHIISRITYHVLSSRES